ncbi:MAG: fructose-6-phosphate aldolase [Planctomycetota bacterium]|nr:MAG: fructose-6-phosphate aldolase [Planctomycetota bacterium]
MQIFLDTANMEEIRQAHSMGVLDGVTTNPSLIAKEGRDFRQTIYEICELVQGPVSAEVVAVEAEKMIEEAKQLAAIHRCVVVKLPTTAEGLKAAKVLSDEGIDTNLTLCFSASQALLAAKAGATYVSPFVGRLDDINSQGMELIEEVVSIFQNYDFPTQVLVASIRHPLHFKEAALLGADVATVPFGVFEKLLHHPLTKIGVDKFLADWNSLPEEKRSFLPSSSSSG